jgi:hypothetical protein
MDTSRRGRMTREPAVERAIEKLDVDWSHVWSHNWDSHLAGVSGKSAYDAHHAALDAAKADLRAARRYKRLAGLLTCTRPAVRRAALLVLAME